MRALFAPATAIMNRLRYTQKFILLGLLMATAIGILVANLYGALDERIKTSQSELNGIAIIKPLQRTVQFMQQHRGMSAGVLAGNEEMKVRRAGKEKEVSDALNAVGATLPPELAASKMWKSVLAEWKEIVGDGLNWTSPENFGRHTEMIDKVFIFMTDVADATSLTTDPGIDTYYLFDTVVAKAPVALERLGRMRAKGTAVLTKKQMLDQQKTEMTALMSELNNAVRALHQNLEKTALYNPDMKASLGKAGDEFEAAAGEVNKLIVEDMLLGIFQTEPKEYFALTTKIIDSGYKQMFDVMLPTANTLIERRIEKLRRNLTIGIIIATLMIGVVAYFAIATYIAMIDSLNKLAETARTLSTGDLRPRVELKTRDELRLVGDSFNQMAEAFSALLRSAQRSTEQVLQAAQGMAESSGQITQSSEAQSEAASSMAAAVEQMTVGIDHISKNAVDANDISNAAGNLSAEGGRIVGTVVDEIRRIAASVNDSANIIDELGRQSDEISAIVNVIKEIADQTNLLALNAAIEAARAGESGRGFAVVADEVRKLAERTTKSTQEISSMIGAIQTGTQNAVAAMRDGVTRVNDGVVLATQAGEAMGQIQGSAGQVVDTVAEISSALREQSAASTEIAKNVERIAQMAEENNSVVAQNASTATDLERLAAGLQSEIRRFRVS